MSLRNVANFSQTTRGCILGELLFIVTAVRTLNLTRLIHVPKNSRVELSRTVPAFSHKNNANNLNCSDGCSGVMTGKVGGYFMLFSDSSSSSSSSSSTLATH
jgi:hypothetical protein